MVCWYMIPLNGKQLCIRKGYKAHNLSWELKCKAQRFLLEMALLKPQWSEEVSSMLKRQANEISFVLLGIDSL